VANRISFASRSSDVFAQLGQKRNFMTFRALDSFPTKDTGSFVNRGGRGKDHLLIKNSLKSYFILIDFCVQLLNLVGSDPVRSGKLSNVGPKKGSIPLESKLLNFGKIFLQNKTFQTQMLNLMGSDRASKLVGSDPIRSGKLSNVGPARFDPARVKTVEFRKIFLIYGKKVCSKIESLLLASPMKLICYVLFLFLT
jgi:hypothetical protein